MQQICYMNDQTKTAAPLRGTVMDTVTWKQPSQSASKHLNIDLITAVHALVTTCLKQVEALSRHSKQKQFTIRHKCRQGMQIHGMAIQLGLRGCY